MPDNQSNFEALTARIMELEAKSAGCLSKEFFLIKEPGGAGAGHKRFRESQDLVVDILRRLNKPSTMREVMQDILKMVKRHAGVEAAAIRLREGDDFPYYVVSGFSESFLEAERKLCVCDAQGEIVRDPNGIPLLACMCGNVLSGRTDASLPFFTHRGSFWTNSTEKLLASTSEEERQGHTRNRCFKEGYMSVALVPLQSDGERIGLLQLNDSREGCFTLDLIEFMEGLGESIGVALKRFQIDNAMRMSEEKFRSVVETAVNTILVLSPEHRILEFNPEAERLYGRKRSEILGKNYLDLFIPESERGVVAEDIKKVLAGKPTRGFENPVIAHDGKKRIMSWNVSRMLDAQGRPASVIAMGQDVTDKKQAERSLRFTQFSIDQCGEAAFWMGKDARFIYVNESACRSLGYTKEELLQMSVHDIDPDFPREAWPDHWEDVKTRKTFSVESHHRTKDGRVFPVEIFINYMEFEGQEYNCAFATDITERVKAKEKLEEVNKRLETAIDHATLMACEANLANRSKSEFLASMSHEIRTPMNGIIGMAELMSDSRLDKEQQENLNIIKSSAKSLLTIIDDILDLSKIEAGQVNLEQTDFSLRSIVEVVFDGLAVKASEKRIELINHIDPTVPDQLKGDPTRLSQILLNLIGNSVKFTEKGEVVLRVEAESRFDGSAQLHFTIADTGIGIPEDRQAAIFESFTQADDSTTRKYGGTGLGTTISKQLVELMGGEIRIESPSNNNSEMGGPGTTFHFKVKFDSKDQEESIEAPADQELAGMKVLVVEDNASLCKMLCSALKSWGMVPDVVASAAQALDTLDRAREDSSTYSMVLLDETLPDTNGSELTLKIRANPAFDNVKIVLMTSIRLRGYKVCHGELPLDGYLTKPIKQFVLLDAVKTALGVSQSEAPVESAGPSDPARYEELGALHFLLAEDNPVNQKVIVRTLEKMGHTVEAAGNGHEAVAAVEKERFDIVLMDVQMPGLDGLQATKAIRMMEKETGEHVPIIALTACAMKGDRERCVEAGMDSYLSKPIEKEKFFKEIARLHNRFLATV